jgi:hypothetical protein
VVGSAKTCAPPSRDDQPALVLTDAAFAENVRSVVHHLNTNSGATSGNEVLHEVLRQPGFSYLIASNHSPEWRR